MMERTSTRVAIEFYAMQTEAVVQACTPAGHEIAHWLLDGGHGSVDT
jgi:hypothetical protein